MLHLQKQQRIHVRRKVLLYLETEILKQYHGMLKGGGGGGIYGLMVS